MQADPTTPLSVAFCNAMIRVAAKLVPAAQREDWRREWLAEIWHRWQFLFHADAWDRREAARLVHNCVGAFADAAWHVISQETLRNRLRDSARSPWTCLGGLAAVLAILAAMTSGFPATRQLLAFQSQQSSGPLLFIWLHPTVGGPDRGLPPDVAPAWARHSRLLESVAAFNINRAQLALPQNRVPRPLIVTTEPALFQVLRTRAAIGEFPSNRESSELVLDYPTWVSLFHRDPKVIGSRLKLGRHFYRVSAVLPADFHFLTRQASAYLVQPALSEPRVIVVARARPGTAKEKLDRELTKIAEDFCYYFFTAQLRFGFFTTAILTPLGFFGTAVLVSAIIALAMCRVRVRHVRFALRTANRRTALLRAAFFAGKLTLALAIVFIAGLEWARSESSVLLASKDPASGPFLVWLYILGAMGVFFWSVADQRARCRVCLRLLCFPVRIGCPGCLLLDWSGTELLCSEGHGVLHVPHLAPSWDEEAEHWIALDESWQGLFAHTK
jgi:hypothetical protein